MLDRSKILIISILLIAFSMAGFGVAYRYIYGRKALALWGPEHAARIKNAEAVTWFKLQPATDPSAAGDIIVTDPQGRDWQILLRGEIGQVADLLHIRRVFVQDVYFDWEATEHPAADWTYALQFQDATGTSTILVASDGTEICLLEADKQASILPGIHRSIRQFINRFGPKPPPAAKT